MLRQEKSGEGRVGEGDEVHVLNEVVGKGLFGIGKGS